MTDPKGENLAITARWRAETLGHHVVALDPFGLASGWSPGPVAGPGGVESGGLNPLDLIGAGGPARTPRTTRR